MIDLVEGYRNLLPHATTSSYEVGRYATEDEIASLLRKLSGIDYRQRQSVCYVLGTGGQPQSTYADLEKVDGLRVIKYSSLAPLLLRFIPGYRGLVKVDDPSVLPLVFNALLEQSIAGIYIFDVSIEQQFLQAVGSGYWSGDPDLVFRSDSEFFIYVVDEDRDDSPTGMVEAFSMRPASLWQEFAEVPTT